MGPDIDLAASDGASVLAHQATDVFVLNITGSGDDHVGHAAVADRAIVEADEPAHILVAHHLTGAGHMAGVNASAPVEADQATNALLAEDGRASNRQVADGGTTEVIEKPDLLVARLVDHQAGDRVVIAVKIGGKHRHMQVVVRIGAGTRRLGGEIKVGRQLEFVRRVGGEGHQIHQALHRVDLVVAAVAAQVGGAQAGVIGNVQRKLGARVATTAKPVQILHVVQSIVRDALGARLPRHGDHYRVNVVERIADRCRVVSEADQPTDASRPGDRTRGIAVGDVGRKHRHIAADQSAHIVVPGDRARCMTARNRRKIVCAYQAANAVRIGCRHRGRAIAVTDLRVSTSVPVNAYQTAETLAIVATHVQSGACDGAGDVGVAYGTGSCSSVRYIGTDQPTDIALPGDIDIGEPQILYFRPICIAEQPDILKLRLIDIEMVNGMPQAFKRARERLSVGIRPDGGETIKTRPTTIATGAHIPATCGCGIEVGSQRKMAIECAATCQGLQFAGILCADDLAADAGDQGVDVAIDLENRIVADGNAIGGPQRRVIAR